MEKIKPYLISFKNKFLFFCDLVFSKINTFFYYIGQNLFFNFSNFLIVILTLIIIVFYRSIIEVLNFELFGSQFTFGDSLNNLVSMGFESIWNLMISLVRSFSPSGPIGLAFEILTETIALILVLIGYIIYFLIITINFIWYAITQFGLYNIVVILSWSYLIGLFRFAYSKILDFINSRKAKKQIPNIEENTNFESNGES
tara:strand:+ start:89 stop:688 length:600 start_codon:yes stop_codon:yes gene_type:complete